MMLFRVPWRKERAWQPLVESADLESFVQPEVPTPVEEPALVEFTSSNDLEPGKGAGASLGSLFVGPEGSALEAQLQALAPRVSWTVTAFDPFAMAAEAPNRDEVAERFFDLERAVHELFRGCAYRMAQSQWSSDVHDVRFHDETSIFHALLSIYTQQVYTRLLDPSNVYTAQPESHSEISAAPQLNTSAADLKMSRKRRKASLLTELKHAITTEVCNKFSVHLEDPAIPIDFVGCLRDILLETYVWNESAHWQDATGAHGFHAFLAEPSSHWDPDTMEAFECADPWMDPSTATISPVSFGLKDNDASSGGSSKVVRKVKVLLRPMEHNTTPLPRTPTTDTGPRSVNSLFASEPVDGDTRATSPQLDADAALCNPFVTSGDTEKLDVDKSTKKHGRVRRWFRKVVKGKS